MDGLVCDRCDEPLLLNEDVRYVLTVAGHAAYDPMELTQDSLSESGCDAYEKLLAQLAEMSSEEIERQVQFRQEFDLCAKCWKAVCDDPLGRNALRSNPSASSREDEDTGEAATDLD